MEIQTLSKKKLVELIAGSLIDKPIPIAMLEWRDRSWLRKQDRKTLLRCYIKTAEFRLNPDGSTDFLEHGISPAERHARAIEFVIQIPVGDLRRFTVELIERAFLADEALASAREGVVVNLELAQAVAKAWGITEDRRKERNRAGVRAKLANDKSGKHRVMNSIQSEWKRRKDAGLKFTATAFAKEMAKRHKDAVTVERIKNAQTTWNREYHPTG